MINNSDIKIKFFRQKNQIPHENRHNEKLRQEYQMVSMLFVLIKCEKKYHDKKETKQSMQTEKRQEKRKFDFKIKFLKNWSKPLFRRISLVLRCFSAVFFFSIMKHQLKHICSKIYQKKNFPSM
jgi:hypothetical protein